MGRPLRPGEITCGLRRRWLAIAPPSGPAPASSTSRCYATTSSRPRWTTLASSAQDDPQLALPPGRADSPRTGHRRQDVPAAAHHPHHRRRGRRHRSESCVIKGAGVEQALNAPSPRSNRSTGSPRGRATHRLLVLLATFTALRFGELAALTRRSRPSAGVLSVTRRGRSATDANRGQPKTPPSTRSPCQGCSSTAYGTNSRYSEPGNKVSCSSTSMEARCGEATGQSPGGGQPWRSISSTFTSRPSTHRQHPRGRHWRFNQGADDVEPDERYGGDDLGPAVREVPIQHGLAVLDAQMSTWVPTSKTCVEGRW